ncbi:MAG: acetylxylan esterase [candidate division KSB1 bacterium]|nr:acetylxylan esterase [candidate division KSB1 bacterium]
MKHFPSNIQKISRDCLKVALIISTTLISRYVYPQTAGDGGSLYSESNLLDFYRYDKTQPFEATLDTAKELVLVHYKINVTFKSIHNETVTARLYIPTWATPETPTPCVFWLHGYGGNKDIPDEAFLILGPLGYAFMSLDAQYHGARHRPAKDIFSLDLVQGRYALAQTVIDYRRAMDFLETLPQIDSNRMGLIGASMGGIIGALLAGVDERIKVAVLIAGGGDWEQIIRTSQHFTGPPLRDYLRGQYLILHRFLDPVDPINFIHRLKVPLALQMHHGTEDVTVPYATARTLFDKAGEPKEFWSYSGKDHFSLFAGFNSYYIALRTIRWLKKYL